LYFLHEVVHGKMRSVPFIATAHTGGKEEKTIASADIPRSLKSFS